MIPKGINEEQVVYFNDREATIKAVNEGDKFIQKAASLLRNSSRAEDVVARTGGDEFVIILPQAPFETAMKVADVRVLFSLVFPWAVP